MHRGDAVWGGLFAAGIGYELWAIRKARLDYTLSRTTRRAMFLHTRGGRLVFTAGWMWFAGWFLRHVMEFGEEGL
ncbi:hypothetical protein BJP40_06455 [Streptomyces sp. CC53]|uniref:hypothetical protein n=1 Tax=Streptomyces sp. CC53 TaxID=1906740 RepID=UPI0008DE0E83|nr:hypothetical protein [Streptomyces sp. CC53]OII61164.1 hypothetical protein BJP40_06455 [Streptomyces sp. CC53]